MSEEIVQNPTVPFFTHFHNEMKNGIVFNINGTVSSSANSFFVNFQGSIGNTDDIALHFNVRFDEGIVIWNTKEQKVWGKRGETAKVPFTKGQPFEIQIIVTDQEYKVSVDKNHFLDYPHRIPLNRVNTLAVDGAISLQRMEVEPQGIGFHHHYFPGKQRNTVPLGSKFPSSIKAGTVVIINGSIPPLADRFDVNFRTGDAQRSDIAYQFNPRLEEGQVISNGRKNNIWLQSEAKSEMPFAREKPFELRFLVTDESYKVYVNGNYFLDYNYKIPLNQVNTLAIMGCVILNRVEIQAEASGFHHLYFQGEHIPKSVPLVSPFLVGPSDGT
ncbi:galectin-9-like, partial [Bufo gargarizans]|uniref:galectin-9-like n=1 Tax=Bufo gargarizans TaxID=30331 RepID=UPI001CF5CF1B